MPPDSSSLLWVVGVVIIGYQVVYRCMVLRAKKQQLIFSIKRALASLLFYGLIVSFLGNSLPTIEVAILGVLAAMGLAHIVVRRPSQSRHIPAEVKREVIERYQKNGAKFNPSLHHLDHIVPFSKGGDHSVGNLRVIAKQRNLAKSAKAPRLVDFLRRSG